MKHELDNETKSRLDKFLKELAKLTQKYEIEIGGCGCCGSPYLIDQNNDNIIKTDLSYNGFEEEYE